MSLLDWITPEPSITIFGRRLFLRSPRSVDYEAWAQVRTLSKHHLQPWEPLWPSDDVTRAGFKRRLNLYARDIELGYGFPFFIFRMEDEALMGGMNVSLVRRGAAQSAQLGYWLGLPFIKNGYAQEALSLIKHYSRERLDLHRLEAACLECNHSSRKLLEKSGFQSEGIARSYLKINGVWRDHMIYGLVFETHVSEAG